MSGFVRVIGAAGTERYTKKYSLDEVSPKEAMKEFMKTARTQGIKLDAIRSTLVDEGEAESLDTVGLDYEQENDLGL